MYALQLLRKRKVEKSLLKTRAVEDSRDMDEAYIVDKSNPTVLSTLNEEGNKATSKALKKVTLLS